MNDYGVALSGRHYHMEKGCSIKALSFKLQCLTIDYLKEYKTLKVFEVIGREVETIKEIDLVKYFSDNKNPVFDLEKIIKEEP